jgi:TP901 family phage tail tape measure protein
MEQLPAVLDLAAAGALDLGRAADGVTDILAQFRLEAKDSAMVADQLAKAAGASSATVEDLLQAFGNSGPVMAQFGLSVEESAAALAVLAENGIKGAEAGTQLKSMLLNMSENTLKTRAAWEELGVTMYDAQGNMRDIDDIFKDINKAMQGMSMQDQNRIAQQLAGTYGLVGFNALRASNGISDMQGAMANAAGASEVANARMNTLAGRFDQLMGSIETLAIVLGGLGEGPLVAFLTWLTDVVNGITQWVQLNPQMAQIVMIILAIVAAIGPLLMIVGQLVSAWTAIAAVIPIVTAGFTAFMALGLPLIALIALIVVAIGLLIANWNQLGQTVMQLATIIDKSLGSVFSKTRDGLVMVAQMIAKSWQEMLGKAGTSLSQLGSIIWERLKTVGSQMFTLGEAIVSGLLNGLKSKAVELVAYIFNLSKDMEDAIKRALGIRSPSKVMMNIGENVVAGFHKGIESMGGIGVTTPNTAAASAGMPTVGGTALAGSGGGNVYISVGNIIVPKGTTAEQSEAIIKDLGKKAKRRGARSFR